MNHQLTHKILICEDEDIMLAVLEFRLKRIGYQVLRAHDGEEAIHLIEANNPDLLVLDLMLPQISGLDVIQQVRNNMNISLPIVVISALEDGNIITESLRLGANDFLSKPFKSFELILRIKRILQPADFIGNYEHPLQYQNLY
ncbi:MAG: response regulator transcription factor [Saprospiraceae bacterium]|nr:response regulator transcription factor [Saprospiraceae bacterium]